MSTAKVDFARLKEQYKEDHYRKMETIHHEFLYSCIHPQDKDLVINLERNFFPSSLKIYNLKDLKTPTENKEDTENQTQDLTVAAINTNRKSIAKVNFDAEETRQPKQGKSKSK